MPDWLMSVSNAAGWWGAFTGTIALWITWMNRRDAVRDKAEARKAKEPWATLHHRKTDEAEVLFRVEFHNPTSVEFTITELSVVRPKGARIVVTYSSTEGPIDLSPPAKIAPVNWMVRTPGSRGSKEPTGSADFRLSLPLHVSLLRRRTPILDTDPIEWVIVCKGETSPPMRDPIHVSAKATTSPRAEIAPEPATAL